MSSNSALENMINKVLVQKEAELISQIDSAYQESLDNLESSRGKLEAERTGIVEAARKQAENLKRQIIGSSRLAARNQELLTIENAVNKAFEEAKKKLQASNSQGSYKELLKHMVEESISAVGESNAVIIECNKNDAELLRKVVTELQDSGKVQQARVSDQHIDVLGGIRIKSADGTMTYDNTLDSRIERLKPLIRKNIAQMLRGVE
jgi:V/A-type H+-transporting ATPase subunit E